MLKISYSCKILLCVLSRVLFFVTLWTVALQAPLSRSGLPFPPGDLPNPRIKPRSPALAGRFFTTEPPGKSQTFLSLFCV